MNTISELGMSPEVAINPDTDIATIEGAFSLVDRILVMTGNPSFAGQSLIQSTLDKVRTLRAMLDAKGLNKQIQVDGGISTETAPLAAEAGADVFVATSAISNHPQGPRAGLKALRYSLMTVLEEERKDRYNKGQ